MGKERAQGGQGGRGARGAGDDMFTKKRAPAPAAGVRAPQAPMGVKYQMNPSPRKGPPQGPGPARGQAQVGRGSGVAAVKASRTQQPMGGTFLTGMMEGDYEEESDLEAARRERRRQQAQASDGQRGLKQRVQVLFPTHICHCSFGDSSEPFLWCVQARKARATEQVSGARRHEAALKEVRAPSSVHPLDHLAHTASRSSSLPLSLTVSYRTAPCLVLHTCTSGRCTRARAPCPSATAPWRPCRWVTPVQGLIA